MKQGIEWVDPEKYPYLYALQERLCIEQEEEEIYRLEGLTKRIRKYEN
jgi:hypothetical protein